jgi:hypothetical protein
VSIQIYAISHKKKELIVLVSILFSAEMSYLFPFFFPLIKGTKI